ncbi:MAG: hypothetical protein ABIT04_03415 [Novosphingobium sp.]
MDNVSSIGADGVLCFAINYVLLGTSKTDNLGDRCFKGGNYQRDSIQGDQDGRDKRHHGAENILPVFVIPVAHLGLLTRSTNIATGHFAMKLHYGDSTQSPHCSRTPWGSKRFPAEPPLAFTSMSDRDNDDHHPARSPSRA